MQVVLAVDSSGNIEGKPTTIPDGKLDIKVNETCNLPHTGGATTDPEQPETPSDPEGSESNGGVQIPDDELWGGNDFGIQ